MKVEFDSTLQTSWSVSSEGKVFSRTCYHDSGVEREKSTHASRGYLYIRTAHRNYLVHRLVARYFVPNPSHKPCVNHKDGNKMNNSSSNLEWVSHKENTAHALRMGLYRLPRKNEGRIKYRNRECREVIQRVRRGMTYSEAGEKYNMPYSTVAHLIRGSRREIK